MHASTVALYQKRYLRYIPICDIIEVALHKTLDDTEKANFLEGRNLQILHEHRFITKNGMIDC